LVETLEAVNLPVLNNVVLITGGTYDKPPLPLTPVRAEPSPKNLP